jgi:4Fe-4S ferredoxin
MPLKKLKSVRPDALTLQWVLHVKDYKLDLDKNRCVGCQICTLACPKEAIKLEKQPKNNGEKAKKAIVDVDLAKCNFCGICDVLCPYGAVKVTVNGKHALSIIEKESFPQLIRDIKADASKLQRGVDYEEACPLDLINVSWQTADQAKIDVDADHCPCCRVCESRLPEGAMHVRKFINGRIRISPDRCPEGCTDCLDVCPITGALYLSNDGKKIYPNETFCVYCGACKAVCPVEEALEVKRASMNHTPLRSGAWNRALERLTSPMEVAKELKAKGSNKARESVGKRLKYRVA